MSDNLFPDRRLTLKACYQFYRRGLSHTEIARNLRISRFQVARLLQSALQDGYVTVKILEPVPWHADLERELEERFGLRAAIVVDGWELDDPELKLRVADAAGRYILEILRDDDVLGLSLGSTVQALVSQLPDRVRKRVEVVQLIGGSRHGGSELGSMILTTALAGRFRSRPHLLFAPAVVQGVNVRRLLLADPNIRATFEMFKKVSVSVVGIGSLATDPTSRLLYGGIIDECLLRRMRGQGGIGDLLSFIFDKDGRVLEGGLEDRVISVPLEDYLRVPYRIGVAAGEAKAEAIGAALRGGLVNVIVTDSGAAQVIAAMETGGAVEETQGLAR